MTPHEAVSRILSERLTDKGQASSNGNDQHPATTDDGKPQPDPQQVQYPGYFKDDGGL